METTDCPDLTNKQSGGARIDVPGEGQSNIFTPQSPVIHLDEFNNSQENIQEDLLGREFSCYDSAYRFYVMYANKCGFSVRKHTQTKNKAKFVTRMVYCCSKQGHKQDDKRRVNASSSRPILRVGCQAHMTCLFQKNGKYKVISFEASHNHPLVATPMKHMLRMNRSMSKAQRIHADDAEKSGLSVKGTVDLMSREVGGRQNLGFMESDYRNYIHKKRKINMEKGDAGAILQHLQEMQSKDSSYFYAMQVDEDDMITNIFWADSRSISDYNLFGDVVCFDTTYQTNEYGRPFAPFVGVNHHKQTVVFGASLLYDETISSFRWLFQTFLLAMSGKQPKTILTDQCAAMASAISHEFPKASHRLCVWHIYQNAAKHLSHVFHGSKEFSNDFGTCVYDHEDEDEWLLSWNHMLNKYSLNENNWLKDLFAVREKWAMVYGRHTFTADMKSTQRSESMNNVLKKYLKPKYNLLRFFEHYERVLDDRRYAELVADYKMIGTTPILAVNVNILRHAAEVYTPKVFKLFQEEYMRSLDYNVYKVGKSEMISEYKVSYVGKSEHMVKFKAEASLEEVTCSCMKFTFVGILCAHAMKVLDKKNVKRIPSQYILKRWRRDAKTRSVTNYNGTGVHDNLVESVGKRYNHICRNFREIACFAAEHERLTEYVDQCSIEMLKGLEEIKKDLRGTEFPNASHNPKEEAIFSGNEYIQRVTETNDLVEPIVRGVKRKRTVGRPPNQYKGVLGKKRGNPSTKATKPHAKRKINTEDFDLASGSEQMQPIFGHQSIPHLARDKEGTQVSES